MRRRIVSLCCCVDRACLRLRRALLGGAQAALRFAPFDFASLRSASSKMTGVGLCFLLLVQTLGGTALGQADTGEIDIVVTDTLSKKPLDLARVLLDGPVITAEITSSNGKVVFTDVPDGIYRARIVKRGYSALTSASFEVLDGRLVTVSFALAPDNGGLKVIGTVTAKASATISATSIDQNSP